MKTVFIRQILATHFRNLTSLTLTPHPKLNVFLGRNGQGKTNLLEAISLGSSLKTIRSAKNQELIFFGQPLSQIRAHICGHDNFSVEIAISPQGKKVQVAGKPIRDVTAISEKTAVVTFVPDDLHIVMGGASFRRRLLDQVAGGLFPSYAQTYRRYESALLHRNRVLKSPMVDQAELSAFNHVLATSAAPLIRARQVAIDILRPRFMQSIADVSGMTIVADIAYDGSGENTREEDIQNALLVEMKTREREERARKMTLCGPHLDDVDITINRLNARPIASRGQARAIVLALKMAQMNAVSEHRQLAPILLLDDVVGELDPHNAQRLLDTIERVGTQTFITTTHLDALPPNWRACQTFEIEDGALVNS